MPDGPDHPFGSTPFARVFFFPLEAMEVTGKSKTGEAGRKALIARADARASQLAPIVAELRRGGIKSWYGIAMALNKRGIPTATGRGIWEPAQVRRMMERLKPGAVAGQSGEPTPNNQGPQRHSQRSP